MDYKPIKLDLSESNLKKIRAGKAFKLTANQVSGDSATILLHPANYKAANKAKRAKKGMIFELSPGEILATCESELKGSGIFDSIWKGLKSSYKFVRNNWDILKPIVSKAADTVAPLAGPEGIAARALLKSTTGVGIQNPEDSGWEEIEKLEIASKPKTNLKSKFGSRSANAGPSEEKRHYARKTVKGGSFKLN